MFEAEEYKNTGLIIAIGMFCMVEERFNFWNDSHAIPRNVTIACFVWSGRETVLCDVSPMMASPQSSNKFPNTNSTLNIALDLSLSLYISPSLFLSCTHTHTHTHIHIVALVLVSLMHV